MNRAPVRYHRPSAWLSGFVVLLALGVSVALMFRDTMRAPVGLQAAAHRSARPSPGIGGERPVLPLQKFSASEHDAEHVVQGVVLDPNGAPAASATVSFYRLVTAWPEWRTEQLDQAITQADGSFQFRSTERHGRLVGCEHARFAGGLQEVPLHGGDMQLRLTPGFDLFGFVLNDTGAPVPNARVAIEAVPGELRRAEFTYTSAAGRYSFDNVEAGPVRLVVHHESWQPVTAPAVVIGDRRRVDLRFERPTMAPLRGRVIGVSSQEAIAGATVQLVPINQQLGQVVPIEAVSDADGDFLLEGLPRGNVRVLVRHPRHGAVMRTQSIGAAASELSIELPLRSVVEGQLFSERFDDVFVGGEVLQIADMAGQVEFTPIDEQGQFRFEGSLSPGWAELSVLDRRFAFQRTYVSSMRVRINEDATTALELVVVPATAVRGRFVDGSGKPVGAVEVVQTRVLAESAKLIGSAAWQLDVNAFGAQVVQLFGSQRDQLLAVSARDGAFEIRGMAPGPMMARPSRSGYGSDWLQIVVPMPGSPIDLGDIVLPRACAVTGRVLRGNRAFAGATVTAVGASCQALAITDQLGRYELTGLTPGDYSVRARIPGQPTGSNEQQVTVDHASPVPNVPIVLEVGRIIRGQVTSNDGQPLPGALVSVRGSMGQVQATDGTGSFVLEVPQRRIELHVSLGDRSRQRIVTVAAEQDLVQVELDTPPTCTVVAQVAGLPGRKRLLGCLLRLTPIDGEAASETRTRWVEMPDGELDWNLCPSGRVRIEVWCDGYAPYVDERVLAANKEHGLGEILLEPGSRLRGVVRDEDGSPVADATIFLGEETDLDLFQPVVRSAADGSFVVQGVTSRSARLVARARGFAASTIDLQLPNDVLSSRPLAVMLERGATIEVTVPRSELADGGLVQLRRQGRVLAGAELDDRGRAWFANRSAGTYGIRLFGSDFAEQSVVVEPGIEVVRVALEPYAK